MVGKRIIIFGCLGYAKEQLNFYRCAFEADGYQKYLDSRSFHPTHVERYTSWSRITHETNL